MYQNLVFFPASDELRLDLYKLGLDFMLVRIEGTLQFMVVTNQMLLATDLAQKHLIQKFHVSDSKRQIFSATNHGYHSYFPEKLGRLSKDLDKTGKAFLVVQEDNATYHYIIK